MNVEDKYGVWEVKGNVGFLVEPSELFKEEQRKRRKAREERKILKKLVPSKEEIYKAESEISTIEILKESGLL